MHRLTFPRDNCFFAIKHISIIMFGVFLIIPGCNRPEYNEYSSSAGYYYLSPSEIKALTEKVKQGNMEAAERLANFYLVVDRDFDKASKYLRIPAKSGDARIQSSLAALLIRSSSLKDQEEGVYWYEMSAKNGYIGSQYQLAIMYEKGQIVEQDYCTAKYWYEKVARSGENYFPMVKLSEYYEEAKCVNRDIILAYAWLLAAEKNTHPNSMAGKRIIKKKTFFESQLSGSELKQAKHEFEKLIVEIEQERGKF